MSATLSMMEVPHNTHVAALGGAVIIDIIIPQLKAWHLALLHVANSHSPIMRLSPKGQSDISGIHYCRSRCSWMDHFNSLKPLFTCQRATPCSPGA